MNPKPSIIVGILIVAVVIVLFVFVLPISGYGVSGFFSKAFDKSLSPGEQYERNITVRRYYNVSIRFQKENSSSYLGFNDNSSRIVLRDANGSIIKEATGVKNGRHYILMENSDISSIATASAFSIDDYADIVDQSVNVSYSGAKAYITMTVTYGMASLSGYVVDDLTGEYVDGVHVYAFPDGSDPHIADAIMENVSIEGKYTLALQLNSSMALDVYAKDYDIA